MRVQLDNPGALLETRIGNARIIGNEVIRWRSGKLFIRRLLEDLPAVLAADMHRNIDQDYDNIVVINGPEGSGKSSLAYAIAKAYDPAFDVSKQYVYSVADLKDKLKEGDTQHAIWWLDEASNIANNREWQSQDSRDIVALLEMMRSKGWTLIMCIPKVERLDIYIRESRLRYLIKCEPMRFNGESRQRGFFELRAKDARGRLELIGYGEYPPMPPEDAKIYRKIKLDSQQRKISEVVDRQNGGAYKAKYQEERRRYWQHLINADAAGIDKDTICGIFGITKRQLSQDLWKAKDALGDKDGGRGWER